eukprot:TRINITY_DN113908_c0_g1_i1.p1 TRINITY_DN113908_c0_g1~~TRINITY_DN113908_c0_g1_i1.p1  ORF type:complete len:456 (+),score=13.34 TRINITY_DN113908_c0_g1_i1:113-1369(+)
MGSQDGHLGAVEVVQGKPLRVHQLAVTGKADAKESEDVTSKADANEAEEVSQVRPLCKKQCSVHGLAANAKWLVGATCCGMVHVLSLPDHKVSAKVSLGTPLPPQRPALWGEIAFVASKRGLFAVDLLRGTRMLQLSLPFSARPAIVVDPSAIVVQCDELVRLWPLPDRALPTGLPSKLWPSKPQDLKHPHRQMLVGMAVPRASSLLATLSPEEVRGWHWPRCANSTAELLWTVSLQTSPADGLEHNMLIEGVALALVPNRHPQEPVSLLVLGAQDGRSILRTIALPSRCTGKPDVCEVGEAKGTAHESVMAVGATHPEILLRLKEGGWAVWSPCRTAPQKGSFYATLESLEMDSSSSVTSLGPALLSNASKDKMECSQNLRNIVMAWARSQTSGARGTDGASSHEHGGAPIVADVSL